MGMIVKISDRGAQSLPLGLGPWLHAGETGLNQLCSALPQLLGLFMGPRFGASGSFPVKRMGCFPEVFGHMPEVHNPDCQGKQKRLKLIQPPGGITDKSQFGRLSGFRLSGASR